MTTSTYAVGGMTCDHCVQAVHDELARLPGVSAVEVDLTSGRAVVTSDVPPRDDVVAAAIGEAGYELAEDVLG